MSGTEFGAFLKKFRQQQHISSKVLSTKVGKAVTYVSQLERGLIKNPDYDTCFKIMSEIGYETSKIEDLLEYFNIRSPDRDAAELEHMIGQMEMEQQWARENPNDYAEWQLENYLYHKAADLRDLNDRIHKRLHSLIDGDVDKAEMLLRSIERLTAKPTLDILSYAESAQLFSIVEKFIGQTTNEGQEDNNK